MPKLYDVVAVIGKYTDRDGNEKNRYLTIGAVIEGRNGPALKLETVPLNWNGWAYLNEPQTAAEPRQKAQPARQQAARQPAPEPIDDDIPF